MNEHQKQLIEQKLRLQRGAAIIDGIQDQFRQDGYSNMLNKYGTSQDNSTAYEYQQETIADDMELIRLYEGNGLFTKIIDRPSEEAVKHGLDIDYGDEDISEYVADRLDELDFEDKFATAEKWARLYGGSIIVMLVDDGRGLDEPLDLDNATSIQELRVFERSIVQPDYTSLYNFHFIDSIEAGKPFGEPEYYQVFSIYGYFTVHRTRCLIFRNGRLPEQTTNAIYRYWGIPEYVKIKRALRECITAHEDGVKLMERSVQAIYKMKNLANMLSTDDGENKVLQRLQVIDMARGILNSIAIDTDGEDYDFKNFTTSGIKDIIDATCNMLSAVTNIPQTVLFGRSPAGMNATGDSDLENYYNMVENIQKQNMKANVRTLIDLILRQGKADGKIPEIPEYKVRFTALWSMSDTEQANVEKIRADIEQVKAATAQVYIDAGVLDPEEVRRNLAKEGTMEIEELISEDDLDIPDDTFDVTPQPPQEPAPDGNATEQDEGPLETENYAALTSAGLPAPVLPPECFMPDGERYTAAAVIISRNGRILCAARANKEGLCGPGGHMKDGETPDQAALRETMEEFNIVPLNLIPLGDYKDPTGLYCNTKVYFTDTFYGEPETDNVEMVHPRWILIDELHKEFLYPPFEYSIRMLCDALRPLAEEARMKKVTEAQRLENFSENTENPLYNPEKSATITEDGTNEDGGPGSGRYPKGSGGNSSQTGVSAEGKNKPCTGFASPAKLTKHYKNHAAEVGATSEADYEQKGIKFLAQPCGGGVDGYAREDGTVVRFNVDMGEFAAGFPGGAISTYFVAKFNKKTGMVDLDKANNYFNAMKKEEQYG